MAKHCPGGNTFSARQNGRSSCGTPHAFHKETHMLLSSTGIRLRIYLRTHDGDDILVELESDDIEKAAMTKARMTEEEVHPVKLVRFELGRYPLRS
jgi:hypothetical protein